MISHPEVYNKFKKLVSQYNKFFGDTEQIKRFKLVSYEWSIQTGELTPTLKLRRNFIVNKYKDIIEELFV
jgi:long-chain acyl-CoA synthetase